jgi:hypothetical protein
MKSDAMDRIRALMNKKEGGKSLLGVGGENRPSTFADILYVNCPYLRFSIRKNREQEPSLKEKSENSIIDSPAGQRRIHSALLKGTLSPK